MDPVWTDPVTIGFGLASAAVLVIAALFSTRGNAVVAAFMLAMWGATKVWNYKTGTDAQLYLDTALACLCGLLCVMVMRHDRRAAWPLIILGIMVTWVMLNASVADLGKDSVWFNAAHQFASNVLFGIALFVAAVPGGRRGVLAIRGRMFNHPVRRARPAHGGGWGREAPGAISKRKARAR